MDIPLQIRVLCWITCPQGLFQSCLGTCRGEDGGTCPLALATSTSRGVPVGAPPVPGRLPLLLGGRTGDLPTEVASAIACMLARQHSR